MQRWAVHSKSSIRPLGMSMRLDVVSVAMLAPSKVATHPICDLPLWIGKATYEPIATHTSIFILNTVLQQWQQRRIGRKWTDKHVGNAKCKADTAAVGYQQEQKVKGRWKPITRQTSKHTKFRLHYDKSLTTNHSRIRQRKLLRTKTKVKEGIIFQCLVAV